MYGCLEDIIACGTVLPRAEGLKKSNVWGVVAAEVTCRAGYIVISPEL